MRMLFRFILILMILGFLSGGLLLYSYSKLDSELASVDAIQPAYKADFESIVRATWQAFTGNVLGAATQFIEGVDVDATAEIRNGGILPIYLPEMEHRVTLEGQSSAGLSTRTEAQWLMPQWLASKAVMPVPLKARIATSDIPEVALNALTKGGELNVEVESSFELAGFKVTRYSTRGRPPQETIEQRVSMAMPVSTPTATPIPIVQARPTATPTPTPMPTPTAVPVQVTVAGVRFVSGSIQGTQVTVPLGSSVEVFATLYATGLVTGDLEVEVWKAITLAPDATWKMCYQRVSLGTAKQEFGGCVFLADEATTGWLRQYYVRVYWNGALVYDPTNPDTREYVLTKAVATPTPARTPTAMPTATPTPTRTPTPTSTATPLPKPPDRLLPLGDPFLGIVYSDVPSGQKVERVLENTGCQLAGIQASDVLLSINGVALTQGLSNVLARYEAGEVVEINLDRSGSRMSTWVPLGAKYVFQLPAGKQQAIPITLTDGERLYLLAYDAVGNDFIMRVTSPSDLAVLEPGRVKGEYAATVQATATREYTIWFDLSYSTFTGRDMTLAFVIRP